MEEESAMREHTMSDTDGGGVRSEEALLSSCI